MTATPITDDQVDECGFRMFELHEIAATMAMLDHPTSGGAYEVLGNKRDRMAQYGNAVTPPATEFLLKRLFDVMGGGATFKDLFCGAGGSSIGATMAGGELVLGLNHWKLAIETHAKNFPNADHDCADVSALTTSQIRRYPDSDILLASPECTNHSLAKGALRRKPQAASLFDDGPIGDDGQDRSRATMWDVPRFAEQKLLKGKPYRAMIVENVVDAYKWGADDDGGLFAAWRMAMTNLGYESEIVWLNSMFCPPTPQSRDRMYVVFWQKGMKKPDLTVQPVSWCPTCELVVNGQRMWKRPDRPLMTSKGMPVGARYGAQYLFGCPECHEVVIPGAYPAASAIDWDIDAPIIGERARPLADSTRARIKRGLERLAKEPFAIRLLQGGVPKPLTLPLVTLTRRHDVAMVFPIAGNTHESTPGNRARRADLQPADVVHTTMDRAILIPLEKHTLPRIVDREQLHTVKASGNHHGLVMRNNGSKTESGWESTDSDLPFRALTAKCSQSLVIPFQSLPHRPHEPSKTVTTRDRLALLIPPNTNNPARDPYTDPTTTLTTETRCSVVELKGADA